MSSSPFVVVRYPPGGAGRFLSTAVQLSNDIACWDPELNLIKETNGFYEAYTNYVDSKFPIDPLYHLRLEPDLPYRCDFYSGTYDRGTSISLEQYNCLLKESNDWYYFNNVNSNKKVNLILHKSPIPQFMIGGIFINVIINSQRAANWLNERVWKTHYQVIAPNTIRRLQHDPDYCNPKRKDLVRKFFTGSAIITVDSIEDFKKSEVAQNTTLELFSSENNLYHDNSNLHVTNTVFELDNIFNHSTLIDNIEHIIKSLSLTMPDKDLLKKIYNIWWSKE
jgi:hypothetical protein